MLNIKPVFVLIFLTFVPADLYGQDSVLHRQYVRRDDVSIGEGLKGTKGLLTLRQDSICFSVLDRNNETLDFMISYAEIAKIKRYRGMLLPNRIGIRTAENRTFRIFTYKRKTILNILRERRGHWKG